MSIDIYFGEKGAFKEACDLYRNRIPLKVLEHAELLGDSRIAYTLGYAFARVLDSRGMDISEQDLFMISTRKITSGKPEEFVNGFRAYERNSSAVALFGSEGG